MNPSQLQPLPPDIQAQLAAERNYPPLPGEVRSRALARARAVLRQYESLRLNSSGPRGLLWGAAAAVVGFGALASVGIPGSRPRLVNTSTLSAPQNTPLPSVVPSTIPDFGSVEKAAIADAAPAVEPRPPTVPHVGAKQRVQASAELAPEELRLLQRARAAVAREDFTAALRPLGEYERRFPAGRLREECEALRVKALSGLGRDAQARRAADRFRTRFPRSVLLSPVENAVKSPP